MPEITCLVPEDVTATADISPKSINVLQHITTVKNMMAQQVLPEFLLLIL